jgi:hypothetical protein
MDDIVSFSDEQMDLLLSAAAVLPVQWRSSFLEALVDKYASSSGGGI